MSLMVKGFWISLVSLIIVGLVILGFVGIPAKPVTVTKTISNDRFSQ